METSSTDRTLNISLVVVTMIAVSALLAYVTWFALLLGAPISEDPDSWGTFGDYIGGLLNPLVAACALYWLTASVKLQKAELAATRNELALTRSELAASRGAQEAQARVTHLSAQINSLSLRLDAVTTNLSHVQTRLQYVLSQADINGLHRQLYDLRGGGQVAIGKLANQLEVRIMELTIQQADILSELERVQSLALSEISA